jgi:hypothetical protein
MHPKLRAAAREERLDGLLAEAQLPRDFSVRRAPGDEPEDVALTGTQRALTGGALRVARIEPRLASAERSERVQHVPDAARLQHGSLSACLASVFVEAALRAYGHEESGSLDSARAQLSYDAGRARVFDVDDQEIRRALGRETNGIVLPGRPPDEAKFGAAECRLDPVADKNVGHHKENKVRRRGAVGWTGRLVDQSANPFACWPKLAC